MSTRSTYPMLLLLAGMTLETTPDLTIGTASFLHNSSSSGPLMTSSYMKQSPASHPYQNLMTSVIQLVNVLQWNQVIILSDWLYYEEAEILDLGVKLNSLHYFDDINNSTEIKQLLHRLHTQSFSELHFLLLSNYSMALQFFQMVEQIDRESNRTTDFRHYSFWLVACIGPSVPSTATILPQIEQMENIALISSQNEQTVFNQLLTAPGGRIFSTWKDMEDIKLEDDVFPNKKYRLNNRTLIVSVTVDEPDVMKTEKGFEGFYIDILTSIAANMNFSYEILYSEDIRWGKLVDGRWDGTVGQLERREVDFVLGTLSIHEDREKVMDFLYPTLRKIGEHFMYRLHSEDTKTWNIYLKPFKPIVLVVLLVILVIFSLLVGTVLIFEGHIVRRNCHPQTLGWKHRLYVMLDVYFYMFGILLNRGAETNPKRQITRVLIFTWGIFSVSIAACYSANLVASFAVPKPDLPFTSLHELVRQKEYKWGFLSGQIKQHIFNRSRTGDMKLAWEGVQELYKTDPEVLSDNYSVHISKAMTEKYAYLMEHLKIKRLRSNDCSIHYVKETIIWHQNAMGVPTNSPLRSELEHTLSRIVDSGLLDIWWQKWGATPEDICAAADTVKSLPLQDTVSAFIILFVGLGAACFALMIEVLKFRQSCC